MQYLTSASVPVPHSATSANTPINQNLASTTQTAVYGMDIAGLIAREAACELEERELAEREVKLRRKEAVVEWMLEQQEAVLVEAAEKRIEIATATLDQYLLKTRELEEEQS